MQILSVTLKNFKIHQDSHFEFQPGTNAICGENGAGKTSILEAIAWALFTYQGDYAKEDLIHNGGGSAQVTVAFISSRDGRTYEVQRCTQRGYTLYDPQLGVRLPYTRIQDEVAPWLRQHLGLSPNTDLASLFARTLGVPQGTFTTDFLLTAENRKRVFDAILKVDDYKNAYRQMNSLRRFAEGRIETLKAEINGYEDALAQWEDLKTTQAALAAEIASDEHTLKTLRETLEHLEAQQLEQLRTQQQTLSADIEGKQALITRLNQDLTHAREAQIICIHTEPDYQAYQAAEILLKRLSEQQQARQQLESQRRSLEASQRQAQARLMRLKLQLEGFTEAEANLEKLKPLMAHQEELETEIQRYQQQQQEFQRLRLDHNRLQERIAEGKRRERDNEKILQQLEEKAQITANIPQMERQRDRLQLQLSHVDAARQFEVELKRILQESHEQQDRHQVQAAAALSALAALREQAPILSLEDVKRLEAAIESGLSLNADILKALQGIVADLTPQTHKPSLSKQLRQLQQQLDQRYRDRAELDQRPALEEQQQRISIKIQDLSAQMQKIAHQLSDEASTLTQLQAAQKTLTTLSNPKGQAQLIEQSLAAKSAVTAEYEQTLAGQQNWEQKLAACARALEAFAHLEVQTQHQEALRQQHQEGYARYLQHQQLAQRAEQIQTDLASAAATLSPLQSQLEQTRQEYERQSAAFDPNQLQHIEHNHQTTRTQFDRLSGSLPQQKARLQEIQRQLAKLDEIAQKRQAAEGRLKQCERIRRFINFARKAYKEAGPRIIEQYVQAISREADGIFRELLNRPNVALNWSPTYEILVQEGPHHRRFLNLSGGEQMCAALAVRLALLKVLADIDIAFFDEPTTNMDRARRESLAEAIAQIRSFSQIFVISHDDTFEKATENLVVVTRAS